jgi:protein-S-isoprenylcysteine O-methyltransferase Ste14
MMIRLGNLLFRVRNALFPLGYLLLFVPGPHLVPDVRVAALVGFLVAFAGQWLRALTIGLEYIVRGGRNRQIYAEQLVQGGIFSHCRNPLYVGNLVIILGLGIASNSVLFLALGVPLFALAYWAIVAAEENFLRRKFGEEYDAYCRRVNRFLPRLTGLRHTLAGMRFNFRRLVSAEYGTIFIWIAVLIAVTQLNLWRAGEYRLTQIEVQALWVFLAIVSLGYLVARYLKKSGRLAPRDDQPSAAADGQLNRP